MTTVIFHPRANHGIVRSILRRELSRLRASDSCIRRAELKADQLLDSGVEVGKALNRAWQQAREEQHSRIRSIVNAAWLGPNVYGDGGAVHQFNGRVSEFPLLQREQAAHDVGFPDDEPPGAA